MTKHGCPETLVTDQGRNFLAEDVEKILELMGTEHNITTAYDHQVNRQFERFNRKFMSHSIHYRQ